MIKAIRLLRIYTQPEFTEPLHFLDKMVSRLGRLLLTRLATVYQMSVNGYLCPHSVAHVAHHEVGDAIVEKVTQRVLNGMDSPK